VVAKVAGGRPENQALLVRRQRGGGEVRHGRLLAVQGPSAGEEGKARNPNDFTRGARRRGFAITWRKGVLHLRGKEARDNSMTSLLRVVDTSALFVWIIVDFFVVFSRRPKDAKRSDRFSLLGVMVSVWVGIYLAIRWQFAGGLGAFVIPVQFGGLTLLAVGIALRSVAIVQLGAFHTPDVAIQAGHRVVDTGLYRRVRHPSYLGACIALLGFGLGLGSVPSAAAVVGCALIGYAYRIHVEERALLASLGEDYAAYCRRTHRLIPGVY